MDDGGIAKMTQDENGNEVLILVVVDDGGIDNNVRPNNEVKKS